MSDILSPAQRHRNMAAIHSTSTKPELKLRHTLWHLGFRYRVNDKRLPGKPDIVLPKYHTVIFVHGCFWHGHEGCSKFVMPKTNVEFWENKIRRNRERDLLNCQRLESLQWNVIDVWECELSKNRFDSTFEHIEHSILKNKARFEEYQERRRTDRAFAREQARKRKELAAIVEAELENLYHRHISIRSDIPRGLE